MRILFSTGIETWWERLSVSIFVSSLSLPLSLSVTERVREREGIMEEKTRIIAITYSVLTQPLMLWFYTLCICLPVKKLIYDKTRILLKPSVKNFHFNNFGRCQMKDSMQQSYLTSGRERPFILRYHSPAWYSSQNLSTWYLFHLPTP